MNIALICQYYPPNRTSQAVQMRDLAVHFSNLGHSVFVATPGDGSPASEQRSELDGVNVFRTPSLPVTNVGFVRRALGEVLMPVLMLRALRKSEFPIANLDLVIWYSPSIFFGPVVSFLKRRSSCQSYLILRDMFPEWLVDVGVMKKRFAYYFFKAVASYQYSVADVIGVQSVSNLTYFKGWRRGSRPTVEVLENWLCSEGEPIKSPDSILSGIKNKKIFVYTGNMGVPQGMDILVDLAEAMRDREDIHFLFVGRGTEKRRLQTRVSSLSLSNVTFHDEIDSDAIPDLLDQCAIGLIALHPDHKSHNIPGKFLTYLSVGLPIIARVNEGTDLENIINTKRLGFVYTGSSVAELSQAARKLVDDDDTLCGMSCAGKAFFEATFSPDRAAKQILRL